MAKEWKTLSISDIVYNHVANDCALVREHPEVAYNLINSPHLKPAVLLDSILMQFTLDASQDKLLSKGIPSEIKEHHLQSIRHYLIDEQTPFYHFSEYLICNENLLMEELCQHLSKLNDSSDKPLYNNDNLIEIKHEKISTK